MKKTFFGGIRPDDHKYTANSTTEKIAEPETVSIPLTQHIGVMCRPTVKVGDTVLEGQLIGEIPSGLGCPVHASVSGRVIRINEFTKEDGNISYSIVIENDKKHILSSNYRPFGKKLSEATSEEIVSVIRNSGIVGIGGIAFPTHARIRAGRGKVDKIIINCCETEPFVCSTHRLVMEKSFEIVSGAKIIMKALGATQAIIAIEKSKKDELLQFEEDIKNEEIFIIEKVSSKYPVESEKQLIYSVLGEALPYGKSSFEIGCAVFSADTLIAVFEAFSKGMPMIKRVVTVDGDCIGSPANYLVPIGTPVSHIIACTGELCRQPKKIVIGGPFTGFAAWDHDAPITKNTTAVLVLSDFFDRESKLPPVCVRCGRCIDVCPMQLSPVKIAEAYNKGNFKALEKLNAEYCTECGCCSYICPGGVPVAQIASTAKSEIIKIKRRENQ